MLQMISSAQTFVMKLVFAPIWILGFGAATLSLWFGAFNSAKSPVEPIGRLMFPFAGLLGAALILYFVAPLKRVRMDGANLYVSNYFKEIAVPVSSVREVTENRWVNINPVTLHLKSTTPFGDEITFMPTARLFPFFRSHPIVADLRKAAGLRAS